MRIQRLRGKIASYGGSRILRLAISPVYVRDAGGAGAAAAEAVGEGHGELPMDVDEEREAGLMAREDGWKSRRRGRVEIGMVAPAIPGQTRAVPGSRFVTAGVS